MATCGNRAKAARHRVRLREAGALSPGDSAFHDGISSTPVADGATAPADALPPAIPAIVREMR
jgi:hypothetical protein